MAKRPILGAVKTRLARDIGSAKATGFYRHLLKTNIQNLGNNPRWQSWCAITPEKFMHEGYLPDYINVIGQGRGDLGQRLTRLARIMPKGPVVFIGSDIPGITTDDIAEAFKKLGEADVVFGPSPDGGYWLIGLKRLMSTPEIFANVRWSSPHTLADTLANTKGLKTAKIRMRADIDTGRDFVDMENAGRLIPSGV